MSVPDDRLLEVLGVVAQAANEATSAEEAFRIALEEVCSVTGWPAGHVLAATAEGLVETGTWHPPGGDRTAQAGAATTHRVPVVVGPDVVAVLEFFLRDGQQGGPELLDALTTVGTILGRVVEGARAEAGAIRDSLTGLFSRAYLDEALRLESTRAGRSRSAIAIIALGMDGLEALEAARGREAVDGAVRSVGVFLGGSVRQGDVPSRYGDDFVIVLPGVSIGMGRARAQQLRRGATALGLQGVGATSSLTLSAGLACFPEHGATPATLLGGALDAMRKATAEGGDRLEMARASTERWTQPARVPRSKDQRRTPGPGPAGSE